MRAPSKADFQLYVEYCITIWLVNNMLIILLLTFWHAMIQCRKGELIFFVYMFFETNYILILLWCVTFQVQVQISLYNMSLALESFNRPFMRLWFYTAFIQIEFGSSVSSISFTWKKNLRFIDLRIQYKKKKYNWKRSIRSINPLKLIKRV